MAEKISAPGRIWAQMLPYRGLMTWYSHGASGGTEYLRRDLCASGQQVRALDVDDLAQIIRVVDGNNTLGAGELAEAILEAMPAPRIVGAPQPEAATQTCMHLTADMAARCATCNPGLLPTTQPEGQVQRLSEAIRKACDLLAERSHGSPARSPAHNARLLLEAALAPQPSAATPTAQEAVPVGWITDKALRTLLSGTSGIFRINHGKRRGTECRVSIYAHPPQPSETVAEAQIDAIAVVLSKRIYKRTEGEWQPSIRQADELARAALRALKGGDA